MKLYLLSQNDNNGYDTYDACVVCAENEEDAKIMQPKYNGFKIFDPLNIEPYTSWAKSAESISCVEIGEANENQKRGIILASFNAG